MKKICFFSPLLLILFLFSVYGCQNSPPYDLSYREKSFCAQVEGNQFGENFCCDIYCEDGKPSKIVYSAPASLQNVTVLISNDGSFEIERNGISATFPQNSRLRSGLLLPAHRLLLDGISRSSVNSVQKISGGILLNITLPDETHPISASFGEDGLPTVISGEDFSYRVHFR